MTTELDDHRMAIQKALKDKNLSATPQAISALVGAVMSAAPEVIGDSDSLILGLFSSSSYTTDLLRDSGANLDDIFDDSDWSAARYKSPIDIEDVDKIKSLFSEQGNLAGLLSRVEFRKRPIEASDILQQAISPFESKWFESEWLVVQPTSGDNETVSWPIRKHRAKDSDLRIHEDIEMLVAETLDGILEDIWEDPNKELLTRREPLSANELNMLFGSLDGVNEERSFIARAVNTYLTERRLPTDDPQFINLAISDQAMPTFGGTYFVASGGSYNDLALSLNVAKRFAPERDQPILGLVEQDGRIVLRHYTYRGTGRLAEGENRQILSVSSPIILPLIHDQILREFEELINSPRTREAEIQKFIQSCPEIIHSLGYSKCTPHVILSEPGERDLIPDFILHRPGGKGFDILDLKLPQARISVNAPYLRISHEITKAIAQLRAYRNFFHNPTNRSKFVREHNIEYFQPKLIVTIGRQSEYIDNAMRTEIESQADGIRVLTYDELVSYAKMRSINF